ASCTAEVSVVDRLAPELTCPADQTVDPGAGNLFYILPDYFATGEAIADDNCTDPVTITTQNPAPGTPLSDGTYTITMTATDEYGNASTCDFELTVETTIGVAENSLDKGLALYPNPADNVVNLVNKTNISLEKLMIYDINGKLVNQT
ncbi:HYR domain-containing protein, partial [Aequorivita sp. SDUM287046]